MRILILPFAISVSAGAQVVPPSASPPPATQLEAFKPRAGTVTTLGIETLYEGATVMVQLQEMRDARGIVARGVRVQVTQGQYNKEAAFVDPDELAELLRGVEALLNTQTNPTRLANFELTYSTKGGLDIIAYSYQGFIRYAVRAGRIGTATSSGWDASALREIQAALVRADERLSSLAASPK